MTLICQNISVQAVLSIENYENFMFYWKALEKMNWNLKKSMFLRQLIFLEYKNELIIQLICQRQSVEGDLKLRYFYSSFMWPWKWNLVPGTG